MGPDDLETDDASQPYGRMVASTYDDDPFGLFAAVRARLLSQVERVFEPGSLRQVADLGAGTGEALRALHGPYPQARLTAVDLSADMLEVARHKLPGAQAAFHAVSALDAPRLLPEASQDLVLTHFLMAYVPPAELLPVVRRLLRPGGYYSVATTTYAGFGRLRDLALEVVSEETIREFSHAPDSPDSLRKAMRQNGLEPVAEDFVRLDVSFASIDELLHFALSGGWLAEDVARQFEPQIAFLREEASDLFPLSTSVEAPVMLARAV